MYFMFIHQTCGNVSIIRCVAMWMSKILHQCRDIIESLQLMLTVDCPASAGQQS